MLISMDEPNLSSRFNSKYLKSFLWLMVILLFFISPATLSANERVRLKLKSSHQFQFAGYYAAVHKGFYQAAGLTVDILEAGGEQRTVESVVERRVDFAIAGSELVIDSASGYEIVALAPIFQHSALALITLRDTNFTSLEALTNQRIMLGAETSSIDVFLRQQGRGLDDFQLVRHVPSITPLITGDVAAMAVRITDEPFIIQQSGNPVRFLRPVDSGIDFYGDTLFTSRALYLQQPQMVQAFVEASIQGWQYALEHPDEIIDLLLNTYGVNRSREHLLYEAKQIRELVSPGLIGIGHSNPVRWQMIADTYDSLNLLPGPFNLETFVPPKMETVRIPDWLKFVSTLTLLVLCLFMVMIYRQHRLNQNLKKEIRVRKDTESRLRLITDSMHDVIWVMDENFKMTYVSPSVERLTGFEVDEVLNKPISDLINADTRRQLAQRIQEITQINEAGRTGSECDELFEFEIQCKFGRQVWVESTIKFFFSAPGIIATIYGSTRDITDRHRQYIELKNLASMDFLTGVKNRRIFFEKLQYETARFRRHGTPLSLIVLDIDHFKKINDRYGHSIGDEVLRQVVKLLEDEIREMDTIGRLGGEEFGILLPDTALEEAHYLAERLREHVSEYPLEISGVYIPVTASFGVVQCDPSETVSSIYKRADVAAYAAKAAGRNCVRRQMPAMIS